MKKIYCIAMLFGMMLSANAASFNWNLYTEDAVIFMNQSGTAAFSGDVTVWMYADTATVDTAVSVYTFAMSNGIISSDNPEVFSTADTLTPSGRYNFYITYEDNGYTFQSDAITNKMTSNISSGTMVGFSSNAGTWTTVPEPTSGLLLLCGLAGLALRRKKA